MTCHSCHSAEMEPTQVSRGLDGLGFTGYLAANGLVLMLGTGGGLIVAPVFGGDGDVSTAVLRGSALVIACAPLVTICAFRICSEKTVWYCRSCHGTVDRV